MGKEHAVRIQTSILNKAEKKALVWLAERQPRWITSDTLTFIGLFGAIVCAVGFVLSNIDLNYLWLASGGLFINWYGDSLDGTLARVRNTQRPTYGFFVDHNIDVITIGVMCIGAGLSPLITLPVAMLVLVAYLSLSIYTYIGAILKNEFRLTYGSLGPTEFRLIVVVVNTLFIYLPLASVCVPILGHTYGIFDFVGITIAAILFVFYIVALCKDRREYAKIDPLKKFVKPEKEQ